MPPTATATHTPSFAAQPPPAFLLARVPFVPPPLPPAPWHAVRVAPRREFVVADALDDLGLESYCPRYWLSWVHRGRRREVLTPYLFAWLFARWNADDAALWHVIRSFRGVVSFIGGERPSPIPDFDIARLRERIGEDNRLVEAAPAPSPYEVGDAVRLTEGPWAGYNGTVVGLLSGRRIARVEVFALQGRTVSLTCSASWCEPVPAFPPELSGPGRSRKRERAMRARFRTGEAARRQA